jgi:hypothetical protein
MKRSLVSLVLVSMLAACSSTKMSGPVDAGPVTSINAQKLETTFKRRGVKLEWECAWGTGAFGLTDAMCVKGDIKAVEVTGYAPSYGNSEVMRENAFKVAEMQAKAKLRRFIQEDVSTTQVQNVLAKSVEKANDRIKNRIKTDEAVSMSEEDASKDTNFAVRENTNDTTRTVTETIRVNAQGILKGVRVIDEQIVDRQTVAVVIRWDKENESGAKALRKAFGN